MFDPQHASDSADIWARILGFLLLVWGILTMPVKWFDNRYVRISEKDGSTLYFRKADADELKALITKISEDNDKFKRLAQRWIDQP